MSDTDLVMYRGDDRSFLVTLAVDPTDADIRFTAKRKLSDADEEAVIALTTDDGDIVIVDANAKQIRVTIPRAATASLLKETRLWWDLQLIKDDAVRTAPEPSPNRVTLGKLLIRMDVTRAETG